MNVSSVHLAVARETLCTRTTTSAGAHTAARISKVPQCVHAQSTARRGSENHSAAWARLHLRLCVSADPPARSVRSGPHQIPLPACCLSQCALAVARMNVVANGEKQRPQPVLQRNGVSLEETNRRKSLTLRSRQDVVLRHCRRSSCERSCIFVCCAPKPLR